MYLRTLHPTREDLPPLGSFRKLEEFLNGSCGEFLVNRISEFIPLPAFKAILFLAPPGDVPVVETRRHTFSPPEVAGIQRYVSPPARNIGTIP
jgi:hypothetical protein